MNGDFWCEKCGEPLSVCDGSQWCSEGRKRGIDWYVIILSIENDERIKQIAFDVATIYNHDFDDVVCQIQKAMKGELKNE